MTDTRVALQTHAKVNLFLGVVGGRADGFHEIETVFQAIGLSDSLECVRTSGELSLELVVADPLASRTPADESNLVLRAATMLRERIDRSEKNSIPGTWMSLRKQIPAGAGLGGGSSNAAGALRALDTLWQADLSASVLLELAESLGSDVPFFVCDYGTAVARGRGEIVIPLGFRELWFVVCCSHDPLDTGAVYDAWDSFQPRGDVTLDRFLEVMAGGSLADLAAVLRNDLEGAAISLRPDLELRLADVVEAGALAARVTGSGPTIFGLVESPAHGRSVAAAVAGEFASVYVVGAVPRCLSYPEAT